MDNTQKSVFKNFPLDFGYAGSVAGNASKLKPAKGNEWYFQMHNG